MRIITKNLIVALLLLVAFVANGKKRPNVLFLIADDLTATAIASYENKTCYTPNIDELAKSGVLFTRTYCQYPKCGPSRASLMFGYYPNASNSYGYTNGRKNIGDKHMTISQLFKANGYYSARVSKIFHMKVPLDIERGTNGADDAASWSERYNSQGPEWKAKGEGELVQNNPDGTLPVKGGNVMTIVKADGDDLVHADGKTAKKACELIREHKDEPFFLAVGFVRPHVPFVAPRKYFDHYDYKKLPMPRKYPNDWDDIPKAGINYVTTKKAEMSVVQERKAVEAYYAAVSYMDAQVGKVLKTLRDEGLEDNTIIIFTSDHGFHLGEHDFWMKLSVHEESARVPFIIKAPGFKPAVCNSFCELIDIYPTLADLAKIDYNKNVQGKSLRPLLKDPKKSIRDEAFTVTQNGTAFLLRSDKWAYIQYGENAEKGIELFNMKTDPKQFVNLAMDKDHAEVVAEFKAKLKEKLKQVRQNDI